MAEFVEQSLEKLLPVFENLKVSKLFTQNEIRDVIRRCRRYEYGIAKRSKNPKDFYLYTDFIASFLSEIAKRRKMENYSNRGDSIDKLLKFKGATIHRICSDRFKSEDAYKKEIQFLLKVKLFGPCSSAYTRFLQRYGSNPKNYEEAGRFEYFQNKSAENARTILHLGLRRFGADTGLWLTLFEIELAFVKYVYQRMEFLKNVGKDKVAVDSNANKNVILSAINPDVADDVLNLKLVDIVYSESMKAIPESIKLDFLTKAWNLAKKAGEVAEKIEKKLFDECYAKSN